MPLPQGVAESEELPLGEALARALRETVGHIVDELLVLAQALGDADKDAAPLAEGRPDGDAVSFTVALPQPVAVPLCGSEARALSENDSEPEAQPLALCEAPRQRVGVSVGVVDCDALPLPQKEALCVAERQREAHAVDELEPQGEGEGVATLVVGSGDAVGERE